MGPKTDLGFVESVFEIGMVAASLAAENKLVVKDSRCLFGATLVWAREFEQAWSGDSGEDYYVAIAEFAKRKLLEEFKADPLAEPLPRPTAIILVRDGLVRWVRSTLPTLEVIVCEEDADNLSAEGEAELCHFLGRFAASDMHTVY